MKLPVCICGINNIPEQHTLDLHDELSGNCRSFVDGRSCSCTHFQDSGRTVEVKE